MLPAALLQQMAGEVVLVEALHDHDNRPPFLVVQAGDEGAGVELDDLAARRFRHGLVGLERIVDDDQIGAAAGERAAD